MTHTTAGTGALTFEAIPAAELAEIRAAGQLGERLPLEHHERDGLALQQMGNHQPSGARPHYRDARPARHQVTGTFLVLGDPARP